VDVLSIISTKTLAAYFRAPKLIGKVIVAANYYLKIGGTELFEEKTLNDLSSDDPDAKKRAESILNDRLKETRIRIGTLLKTDNVSFLTGAGASMKGGGVGLASIPASLEKELHRRAAENGKEKSSDWLLLFYRSAASLSKKPLELKDRAEKLKGDLSKVETIPLNLEEYLTYLHLWIAGLRDVAEDIELKLDGKTALKASGKEIEKLVSEINRALTISTNLPVPGKETALLDYRRLVKKVLTRPVNLRRVSVFTLNYDTMIEKAADAEGAVLVDGFVGALRRIFRPESYDLDFYFPAQTTEGRVHRFDRALHLYKLHGSINWHRCEPDWDNPYGLYATFFNEQTPEEDVQIYPSPLKYGHALGLPYSELFRRFGSTVVQPQSVLFVIGYGFGDAHVNALILQALAIPSFTLVIVDPSPKSTFVDHLKTLNDERVWLISGQQLGTFEQFVARLLPDLREEEITAKVMRTYGTLASTLKSDDGSEGSK
jgi:hypothetical protein